MPRREGGDARAMQTSIDKTVKAAPGGRTADRILRTCVHCGFCNAVCPTYQLLGDELDGPRGRIYLIKQAMEGQPVTGRTRVHLDRCLSCLACETTCPSGVEYGRLLDIGRERVERQTARPWTERLLRRLLRGILPYPNRFEPLFRLGQTLRPWLPKRIGSAIPGRTRRASWPTGQHGRKMLLLEGCVQPVIAPDINAAAARVLDRAGISLARALGAGCCGAISQHLAAPEEARDLMRRNIDAWWPHIQAGAEALVITASGCGVVVKDYGKHLAHDPRYREKARRVASLARDLSEVVVSEDLSLLSLSDRARVAFHAPCSLQHGQKITGVVERILRGAGAALTAVPDAHLCCGSAGTYSLLQPELSQRLLKNKLQALEGGCPQWIATANIGCLNHLASAASVPVVHWIEWVDRSLSLRETR